MTEAQARIVTEPRFRWWDGFILGKHADDLWDLNTSAIAAAEHARALDARNLMAHAILARQYLVVGEDASRADEAWRTTLDGGGAVVWTATLYDVDYKTYFLLAFDRAAIRIYRFGQFVAPISTHLGMPQFPGPDASGLWRAVAGCLDPSVAPEAIVPWSDVREIKAGNWVLWFKLTRPVAVSSDRGKRKALREIKVNLHGATGDLDIYVTPTSDGDVSVHGIGIGPTAYQDRVRRTIVKFVDPDGRIALPEAKRGAGL